MKRVNIIQRLFSSCPTCAYGLSNSVVSLLDHDDRTIATYSIGDASQLESIDILYTEFKSLFNFVGRGVAKSVHWLGILGVGVYKCYEMIMQDPQCAKDYFTYEARGDKNCGCHTAGS